MLLLVTALAPSTALLYYFYLKDKYEREPRYLLAKAFFWGGVSVLPVLFFESSLSIFNLADINLLSAGYTAFVVAGLVEEGFKLLVFMLIIWRSREFNEMYDGIVYSVFISLGFATVENVGYVLTSSFNVGLVRALTAVPAHALFGVAMGYYLGRAKFSRRRRKLCSFNALFIPLILHGIYDFILFSQRFYTLILFIPYMLYLWLRGLKNVEELVDASPFKPATDEIAESLHIFDEDKRDKK